jgi:hypothetical protein
MMTEPASTLPSYWRRDVRPTENGIYTEVTREDYERLANRVNWSTLKYLKRSPAHYRAFTLERERADTDALRLGRASHVATLEPERFLATHAIWDGGRRFGKDWDKFVSQNSGLEILTESQYQDAKAIADAVRNDVHAGPLIRQGSAEVTMLWTHSQAANGVPGFEIPCKGRLDFGARAGAIVDLKTCRDASPDGFGRAAFQLDYLGQAAFYVDGHAIAGSGEHLPYFIIAVEKEEPHVVQVYTVPERLLDMGRQVYRSLLARLWECRQRSEWPGYGNGPMELQLPRWMQDTTDVSELGITTGEDEHDSL